MKLGVAFSGGGVRSASQLGIMQAFYENGIRPEIFTGTSGGSVIATLLAMGIEPVKALELFKDVHDVKDIAYFHILKSILTKQKIQGIFKGDRLEKSLEIIFDSKALDDVKYPLGIVSTNLINGRQVIFSNKEAVSLSKINDSFFDWKCSSSANKLNLKDIVRASCGLPVVFLPKKIGDNMLVDGGLTNNLPSDIADALGADRVISIDLGYYGENYQLGGIYSIMKQTFDIIYKRDVDNNTKSFDILLNPKVYDVNVLDTTEIYDCYDRGYEYGKNIVLAVKYTLLFHGG
jgi:NTE family protein